MSSFSHHLTACPVLSSDCPVPLPRQVCQTNRDHYQNLGEVAEANKFDRLAQNSLKDLDALRHAYRHGDFVPKFHYETREFQIVK